MSAGLAPWEIDEPLAMAGPQPMHADEYDAIRDDIREAMYDDRALLPELFWEYAVPALGVLAETGAEADNQTAAQLLRRMVQRAKSGVPMNEPEGEL